MKILQVRIPDQEFSILTHQTLLDVFGAFGVLFMLSKTYLDTLYNLANYLNFLLFGQIQWSDLWLKSLFTNKSPGNWAESILRNNNTIWEVLTARGFFLRRQHKIKTKQEISWQNIVLWFFSWKQSWKQSKRTEPSFFHEFLVFLIFFMNSKL